MWYKTVAVFLLLTFSAIGQGGFKREYKLPYSFTNVAKAVYESSPNNYVMCGFVFDSLNGNYSNRLTLFGINTLGQRTWTKKYGNSKFEYLDNLWISRWFYKQGNNLYHAGCVKVSARRADRRRPCASPPPDPRRGPVSARTAWKARS